MGKTLLSISRRIAGKTETVQLVNQPDMAKQEIQRLKDKLKRFYELLPWLTAASFHLTDAGVRPLQMIVSVWCPCYSP
jgi:hypothetical protein